MQPGVLCKSQLLDSLKVYLNKKSRLQPIIGLGSITECVKAGTPSREALYFCEVCVCRLSKADMRNHILGSLHRFNYIKTWHPHLVSKWQESSDLSKLAWPLMDMAKNLEEREGPGDIQLLEVDDAVYQGMATYSENDAVTLINSLRDEQGETESCSETTTLHYPFQSQRTVLLAQNQYRWSKKSLETERDSYKSSARVNKPLPDVDPFVKSEVCLVNPFTLQLDTPEPSVLSEISSFLDDYAGTKPLIGLDCVVKCTSEDSSSYCFLCHCCRIRSNKKDIIDHLTSSSHLLNYLIETHPKEVEEVTADVNYKTQLLQSLAKKVERQKGRGELKVVRVPESLYTLLTGKSYHWCIKMLCGGWKRTNIQKKVSFKGLSVNQTSVGGLPDKYVLMKSKRKKRVKIKRKTVFNVSLPLTKGLVLVERMSFSTDSLPVSAMSPPADLGLTSSLESEAVDCKLDCDSASFDVNHTEISQLQHDICSGDADAGDYIPERNLTVTGFQHVDSYISGGVPFNQSKAVTGTDDYMVYWERRDNRHHGGQESSRKKFHKKWKNKERRTQNEALLPAMSHTVSSYNSSYGCGQGWTDQWYNSTSESKIGVEGSKKERHKDLNSDTSQHYYQKHCQELHMAWNNTNLQTSCVGGHHDSSGDLAPYLDGAWINMQTCVGDAFVPSGSISPYSELTGDQAASQGYVTQSTGIKPAEDDHGWMSFPSHNTRPRTNPDQHSPPVCSKSSGWGLTYSNAFSQPQHSRCYGAHSDFNFS